VTTAHLSSEGQFLAAAVVADLATLKRLLESRAQRADAVAD